MYIIEVNEFSFKSKAICLGIVNAFLALNSQNGKINTASIVDVPYKVYHHDHARLVTNTGYTITIRKEVEE